jgi:hypothetical protein
LIRPVLCVDLPIRPQSSREADRKFKTPVRSKSALHLLRVTGLMLRPSLGAAWLAWAIRAARRLRRRALGRCRATKPASRAPRMAPTPPFAAAQDKPGPYRLAHRSMKSGFHP